jgi:hypothetical protein
MLWIGLIWLRIGTSEHGNELSGSIKCWEILEYLSIYLSISLSVCLSVCLSIYLSRALQPFVGQNSCLATG